MNDSYLFTAHRCQATGLGKVDRWRRRYRHGASQLAELPGDAQ